MINTDDLLNGSAAVPLWSEPATMATRPADVGGTVASGRTDSPTAVLVAWLVLAAALVLANVVTFDSKPGERHVHMSVVEGLWYLIFIVVVLNLAKYLLGVRYHVAGLSTLVSRA
ncbi:MAG TPA: hypothetical protein VGS18_01475 [Thermoplasmata archaeon]|nr:hypothetical protein [Thermoplasmata archaeon]